MSKTSTTHYLIRLLDFIFKHVDEPGRWLNLITIDFKKGFDLIQHDMLIQKLLVEFSVNPNLVSVIRSFLSNRFQRVKYKKVFSDPQPVFCGVPQGTILGPILFLVMINNIASDMESRWKYVDDLSIVEICDKGDSSRAAAIIEKVRQESASSLMTVNEKKSNILPFYFFKNFNPTFDPPAPEQQIVNKTKLLGITITSDLKWEALTTELVKRGNASLQMLKLMTKFRVPPTHLLRIYCTFIRPLLEYAAPVWHFGLTLEQSNRIERIQKRALVIISRGPEIPYSELLVKFELVSLERRRLKLSMDFGKKCLDNNKHRDILPSDFIPKRPPRVVAGPVPKLTKIKAKHLRYDRTFVPSFVNEYNVTL